MTGNVGHGLGGISTYENTERDNGGKSAVGSQRKNANSTFVYNPNSTDLKQDSLDQSNQLTTQDF
jgi:hypothetical protein